MLGSLIFVRSFDPPAGDKGDEASAQGSADCVATLLFADRCQWNLVEGQRLPAGPLHLKHGLAVLRFDGGAAVVVQGPTELELVSRGFARLTRGRLTVRPPKKRPGLPCERPPATSSISARSSPSSSKTAAPPNCMSWKARSPSPSPTFRKKTRNCSAPATPSGSTRLAKPRRTSCRSTRRASPTCSTRPASGRAKICFWFTKASTIRSADSRSPMRVAASAGAGRGG